MITSETMAKLHAAIAAVIWEDNPTFCEHEEHWTNLRIAMAKDPVVVERVLRWSAEHMAASGVRHSINPEWINGFADAVRDGKVKP